MMATLMMAAAATTTAVELRGEVTRAEIGSNAWQFNDIEIGDNLLLSVPDWDELPPFAGHGFNVSIEGTIGDEDYGANLVYMASATHAWRRLENSGTYGGSMFSLDVPGRWNVHYFDPWDHENHYDISGTIGFVTGIPEPSSILIWGILAWAGSGRKGRAYRRFAKKRMSFFQD